MPRTRNTEALWFAPAGAPTWGGALPLALTRRGKAGTHGVEPLRALAQAAGKRNAEAVYVLLQGELSDNARDFAREHRLVVLQGQELGALLHKAPQ